MVAQVPTVVTLPTWAKIRIALPGCDGWRALRVIASVRARVRVRTRAMARVRARVSASGTSRQAEPVTFSVSTTQQVSGALQHSKQFVSISHGSVTQSQAHGSLLLLVVLVTGGVGFLGRTRLVSAAEVWRRGLTVGEIWVWVVRC
jgi:hypothetical protein